MNRQEIIAHAIEHAEKLLGMKYSRTYRYRYYPTGSADCSSYMYGCWLAAGFPLLRNGREQVTSCYEVYADGFDLMFPDVSAMIGKPGYWAPKGFYKTFAWEPGDLIFYNFNTKSTRANKITHVAMCYDKNRIIHTANTRENACIKDISYGDGHILAVIRLKADAQEMNRPILVKGSKDKIAVRRMQTLLNTAAGCRLNCDGVFGSGTAKALEAYKTAYGVFKGLEAYKASKGIFADTTICEEETWEALLGESIVAYIKPVFTRELKYAYVKGKADYMRGCDVRVLQERLLAAGYASGAIDGIFGKKTLAALKAFQKARGLEVTGVAGKVEFEALGGTTGG